MSTVWKVLIGLALVVPMGAYVAGSLAASAADDPAPRHTITIREPEPTRSPSVSPSVEPGDDGDDQGHDENDDVEVITPSYDDLDDHGGNRGTGGANGDDHGGSSGSGSSGSGSSGSGSSGSGLGGSDDGGSSGHGGGGDD